MLRSCDNQKQLYQQNREMETTAAQPMASTSSPPSVVRPDNSLSMRSIPLQCDNSHAASNQPESMVYSFWSKLGLSHLNKDNSTQAFEFTDACVEHTDALDQALAPDPLIGLIHADLGTLSPILSDPHIQQISTCFSTRYQRDLLSDLSLFLSDTELADALITLINNDEFREANEIALRRTIHSLNQTLCLKTLAELDSASAANKQGLEAFTHKTMKLREYSQHYQLNRLDLFSPPVSTTTKAVKLLTGSDYIYDGLVKRLSETKDHSDHYHLIMHEYLDGKFTRAFNKLLIEKHQQGVNIRIILCQAGCWQWNPYIPMHFPNESRLVKELTDAGIDVRIQPLAWGLEHEKGIIYKIDGTWGMMMGGGTLCDQTAYPFGGAKFGDEIDALGFPRRDPNDIPEYYDMMIEASGDAALAWQNIFLQRWLYLDGEINSEWSKEQVIAEYFSLSNDSPSRSKQSNLFIPQIAPQLQNCEELIEPKQEPLEKITFLHNVPNTRGSAHLQILKALQSAKSSIHIEIPYLLLEDILLTCKAQAEAGTSVNYLLPGASPRFAESVTNLAMSSWFEDHIDLDKVDIRLCNERYNHGKLIAIDIEKPEHAKVIVMTGNLEPIASGGSNGGFMFDTACIIENMHTETIEMFSSILERDFGEDFSYPLTREHLEARSLRERASANLLRSVMRHLFPDDKRQRSSID